MVLNIRQATICVVGAGYVGLPLSDAFSRTHNVISFDIDEEKTKRLAKRKDNLNHAFTTDPGRISEADFILVCVPTPLTKAKDPDMSYVRAAAKTIGHNMKKGAIVILESSVYPGVTEEIVKPILEEESGFKHGHDFDLAYSPERINPGDDEHNVNNITKIVAAEDESTLNRVADLYRCITPNIFKAKDIKTAEAAKLVENTQRDLNIALVNELSIMFEKMGLSTKDVLDAAATKWNFQRFSPGLVGGYCIPVVPYFIVYKAEESGYHPQIILAGRAINDSIPKHIAEIAIKSLNNAGKVIKGSKVLIMGLTYKENVEDSRETPVRDVIKELCEYGVDVYGYDPLVKNGEEEFGIKFIRKLSDSPMMDCVILTVAHDIFKSISLVQLRSIMNYHPVLVDIRGLFDTPEVHNSEIIYRRL
jgi:UDP-N-acetyl-D-glucosamine/UDP-N-acetyl-D-galactosamine dehydrogenase